ncbi:hypothetical protein DPMN_159077 [Dreissena polymorpha]|uniref:Uncharacterized protein n=1 Tax=Dreissena polymorpha TaxID=45954 RepID=A0A9D4IQE9_DREPO|nr:hypothetical protein DPMN_159077 [Dreissena polymorpha]
MRTTPKKKVVNKKKLVHMSRPCPICSLQGITTLYARVSDCLTPPQRTGQQPRPGLLPVTVWPTHCRHHAQKRALRRTSRH